MFSDLICMGSVQDFINGCQGDAFGSVFECISVCSFFLLFVYLLTDLLLCFHKNVLKHVGIRAKLEIEKEKNTTYHHTVSLWTLMQHVISFIRIFIVLADPYKVQWE